MDALERRVADRMAVETRQLHAEQMTLGKRRQSIAKRADKALAAATKMFAALKGGDVPTKAVASAGTDALKAMGKDARDLLRVNDKMAANAAALAALEDPKEQARRVKHAKELGIVDDKPLTGLDAAEMVLIRRGKATHITDLTNDVLESGIVKLTGRTPQQTMSAYLAKEAAKPDGRIVRIAPGTFWLREKAKEAAKA